MSDTVVVKEQGHARYFYNAKDAPTRFAMSSYYKELNSRNMVSFYEQFKKVYPCKIRKWQNDNGHENMKEFSKKLKQEKIQQIFSYPRCPKINGYIERYNRTLREEFINSNTALIKNDKEFNRPLA
jgi:transposase InsO family protein